jgi:hypothetical protein
MAGAFKFDAGTFRFSRDVGFSYRLQELDALFRAFVACPILEPSANFMPTFSQKIEIAADIHIPPHSQCLRGGRQ